MKKVFLNHDGGVDDLVSLFLLLQMDGIELQGVGVTPADCYLEPALHASHKIIKKFGKEKNIQVSRSNSRGKNPFPKDWRMHAFFIDSLPLLNERSIQERNESSKPAHEHLIEVIQSSNEPITLLFIGPLTDLARALRMAPEIEENITKLVWMGGTFLENGNVEEPEHDGSAEWNAFWDPEAVKTVWDSAIEIDLIGLESTNMVPLTLDIREQWAAERKDEGIDFLGQCYAMVPPLVHFQTNSTYFLWDVLTTAILGKNDLVKMKTLKCIVQTTGPSQGKTELSNQGREVNFVYEVNRNEFFKYITNLARQS